MMAWAQRHVATNPDGSCACPVDGKCWECGKPCTDHDLVADTWWCDECIERSFDAYRKSSASPSAEQGETE